MTAKNPETAHYGRFPDSSFKYTPLRHIRVLFISFVQGLFKEAPKGSYHWDEDEETSEIIVTNESRLDPETINKRPAINFTRGPVQFYSLGIDDLNTYDPTTEKKTKGILVPGTMTINCISRVQQESEDIAWVVGEHIWLLRDLLMRAGFFDVGRQIGMGSPSPAGSIVANDQGDEFTVTPISVPFQFARTSSLTPLGKRIVQGIEQAIATGPAKVYASLGPPLQSHEYPLGVTACPPPPFSPASDVYGKTADPAGEKQIFLPKQPHPLNPAVTVRVRTVRPYRPGLGVPPRGSSVPIKDPCVEES